MKLPTISLYVRRDQLQKAKQAAYLCEITPEAREDRQRIYTGEQALTDEQINEVYADATGQYLSNADFRLAYQFARAIEAAHGITVEATGAYPRVEQAPVAYVTGAYGGHTTYKTIDPTLVLPMGTALYMDTQ